MWKSRFLVHLSRRLKSTIVITRRPSVRCPSVVLNFSRFRLLLWNRYAEFNKTWQEARSQETKSKMSQPIRGQDGHLVFPIGPKNTNLVEDAEILLPIKFRWILFSGFIGKVKNVSANQRLWWPSCFSDRPEKHKLGRGCWDVAFCQVSANSVQQFKKRSRKCGKLKTEGQTTKGWLTTHDHNSALEPSAQVH